MPITIYPSTHSSSPINSHVNAITSPLDHLTRVSRKDGEQCQTLLQSSFTTPLNDVTFPSQNGFVHAAITAYNKHHNLTIRPDDVWHTILSQLSLFINAHAEELRGGFVAHEGKKEIKVTFNDGNRSSIDWGLVAQKICDKLEENVVDPELREWMMPAFSTTQEKDKVVASVLMMASMQKYYSFRGGLCCGLPRVTLLGEKKDWQLILGRLEKLSSWGEEPALFERLLKPVLQRFVRSFDEPKGEEIMRFWGQIAHYIERFSGPSLYSGWITAFCLWDDEGKCMYRKPEKMEQLTLDGAAYHWIESDMVPPGYASVPVKVDDNGDEFDAVMVAGSVGIKASRSVCGGFERLDTMSAESGWWIFEKKDARPAK